MNEIIFDWMDFYQAFANRLLDYKNNREELIVKFKKIYLDANIKWSCLEKDFEGNFIDPFDIDPFTVVGVFNRKMTDENRFRIIKVVKEEFSISEEVPTGFPGIPRIRSDSPRFYAYEPNGRQEDDIDNLWEVFEAAINYSSNPHNEHYRNEFIKWFDKVKDQKGVGLSYFTTGLFWIRPYTFINLDSRNLKFIIDSNLFSDDLVKEIQSIKNGFPSGELYLRICEECTLVIENSDYEHLVDFSYNAFLNDVKGETVYNGNDISLKKDFKKVLDEYLDAKEQIGTTSASIAYYITNDIRQHMNELLGSDKYTCGSSAGKGNLAEIPRIDFGIKNKTNKNQVDVAYLFKSDMSGVYLVLRTFYTEDEVKKFGKYLPEYLKTKSKHIKDFINMYGLKTEEYQESIELLSSNNTAERYTAGTIYSKFYEKSNIPSDEILENDLIDFLNMFEIVLDNYSDNMYLTVNEWTAALEDENLIDSKILNVLEIMYNFENHTACFDDIVKERHKLGYVEEKPMTYDRLISYTSKRLKEHFNKTALFNKENKEEWLSRLFYCEFKKHEDDRRLFYFTIREELVEALEKFDKSKRRGRIEMLDKDFDSSMNKIGSFKTRYWIISAGEDSIWWEDFKQNNELGINFPGTKDVNQYNTPDEIRRDLQEANGDDKSYKNIVNACWQFAHDIQIGDVVFVKHGNSTIIGRGIIESDYKFDDSKPYPKFRKINWTHIVNFGYDGTLPQKTLTDITEKPYLEIIKKLFEDKKFDSFQDYLIYEGYYFSRENIENYLLSLKVKPFIILTGNSGTGKTKLSQLFADYLYKKYPEYKSENNHEVVPVGANWTENRNIVGYYNVLTKSYQHTQSLDLLLAAEKDTSYPYFLILDEMNLSHVERYFSDFLSAMESGEEIPLHKDIDKLEEDPVPENLKIAPNIFIVGTVNIDETTYMFSPKVLDRSNVLEFKTFEAISIEDYINNESYEIKLEGNIDYLEDPLSDRNLRKRILSEIHNGFDQAKFEITITVPTENSEKSEETIDKETGNVLKSITSELSDFNEILKDSGFEFGYRTVNEILAFMYVAWKYEGECPEFNNWKRYFDAQILQKILPKLHGSQLILGDMLDELLVHCLGSESINESPTNSDINENTPYPESAKKLIQMKNTLEKQRYVSFIN